jgi:hypothetical protein
MTHCIPLRSTTHNVLSLRRGGKTKRCHLSLGHVIGTEVMVEGAAGRVSTVESWHGHCEVTVSNVGCLYTCAPRGKLCSRSTSLVPAVVVYIVLEEAPDDVEKVRKRRGGPVTRSCVWGQEAIGGAPNGWRSIDE